MDAPKLDSVLLLDIETAPMLLRSYSLWPKNGIHYTNIYREWFIFCISWAWVGSDHVHSVWSDPDDIRRYMRTGNPDHMPDAGVLEEFIPVLNRADVWVGHNLDKFDTRKINTRAVFYGLPPIPQKPSVDTLKHARKRFAITSNRLDYLGEFHGLGFGKMEKSRGCDHRTHDGDPDAMMEQVEYCEWDIELLDGVYQVQKPWMMGDPNLLRMPRGSINCHKGCGGELKSNGWRKTKTQRYQRVVCHGCGASGRGNKAGVPIGQFADQGVVVISG